MLGNQVEWSADWGFLCLFLAVNAKCDIKRAEWLIADMNMSLNKSMLAHACAQRVYIYICFNILH